MNQLLLKQEHAVYYLKDNITKEILYGGAAGGGKSKLGCLWLIEMCQTYPGTRWLMGRSKLKALTETTLNSFFQTAKELGISNQFKYNGQKNIIYWDNGSEILLKDLFHYPADPEFDSLGSLEITGAFIDECNQIVYKAWEVVKVRIRYMINEYNLTPKILGTCNPAKNWVYSEFYVPHTKNLLGKYDKNKPYLTRRFIQALPEDNPYYPEESLKSLLEMNENSKQRLYYGNWEYDDDPATLIEQSAIFDYFNPEQITISIADKKYITIDVARKGRDKTVFRVWHGWVCIERYSYPVTLTTEVVNIAKQLRIKHAIPLTNIIADEDGVGGGVVDQLKCRGFVNNSSALEMLENGVKIKPNFENLKSQCSIKMAQQINERKAGEICKDSSIADEVAKEMEQVKLKNIDRDGRLGIVPKETVTSLIGRSPDDWDSIMMRYWFELVPKLNSNMNWAAAFG